MYLSRDLVAVETRWKIRLQSLREALEHAIDLCFHVLLSLLWVDGIGREVDENVAVNDGLLAISSQTLFPKLLGLLTLGDGRRAGHHGLGELLGDSDDMEGIWEAYSVIVAEGILTVLCRGEYLQRL